VGLAFQIVDDVLDLTATEEVLGKPVASDLREGKATLSVIHSIDHGTAKDRQTIQRVLDDRSFENVSREQIQEILMRNGSVEYAMTVADRYAEQSRQVLAQLPDSEYKRALLWVPDFRGGAGEVTDFPIILRRHPLEVGPRGSEFRAMKDRLAAGEFGEYALQLWGGCECGFHGKQHSVISHCFRILF
jgi:hypothetical protein